MQITKRLMDDRIIASIPVAKSVGAVQLVAARCVNEEDGMISVTLISAMGNDIEPRWIEVDDTWLVGALMFQLAGCAVDRDAVTSLTLKEVFQ